ncbi:hypothetical protein G6F44_004434 [Rhizopus delemar]|nr:hypothetical protein G6F44_004434 [Rhizopus delemar]
MQVYDQQRHPYPEKAIAKNVEEQWTVDRVILWLEANDFRPAIDFFKANKISGRAFLEIEMPYLTLLRDKLPLSNTEKNRLACAIQSLRQAEYHSYSKIPRYKASQHTAGEPKTPLIPERKSSSNNAKVSTYVNTPFTPTISLGTINNKSFSNKIVRHAVNEKEGGWKLAIRRLNPIEHQQSIHVTTDSDTFHSLQVTGMHDPRIIKVSILKKLGLGDTYSRYLFFHENGKNPDVPLGDEELSHICQISDHSCTNRILVKHILEQYKYYHKDGTEFRDFVPHPSKVNSTLPPGYISNQYHPQENMDSHPMRDHANKVGLKNPSSYPLSERSNNASYTDTNYNQSYPLQQSARPVHDNAHHNALWPVHQDIPPQQQEQQQQQQTSLWAVTPTNTLEPSQSSMSSLWAVPPSSRQYEEKTASTVSLWAVPPTNGQQHHESDEEAHTSNSGQQQQEAKQGASLWAVPPNKQQQETTATQVSLWAIPPKNGQGIKSEASLWAVPPNNDHQHEEKKPPTISLWAIPPSNKPPQKEEPKAPAASLWAVPPSSEQQQEEAKAPAASLWAVSPNSGVQEENVKTTASLWAVPPNNNQQSVEENLVSDHATSASRSDEPSTNLWAVPPKAPSKSSSTSSNVESNCSANTSSTRTAAVPPSIPSPSLWAVAPSVTNETQQFSAENIDLHPSISNKTDHEGSGEDHRHSEEQQKPPQHAVRFLSEQDLESDRSRESITTVASAPPHTLEESMEHMDLNKNNNGLRVNTADRSTSPISPTSPSSAFVDGCEDDNWAERPSVERLYKNIDKYLPGHDLDKEIIEEPTPAVMVNALPPGRKLQGHKKSIRNVANEAHRNWRNVITVVRANNLIRRKNTKMWHRAVEQVKPGMKTNDQQSGDLPKSKKLRWIRGELIGKGSFGRVYHALNVEAGEWIAVKQVDLPNTKSDYANPQLKEIKDGLFREISLLEDLDNEYIVQYLGYNVDEEEGHINIFLEYVPGGSVASCLSKTGKFEIPLVQFFTRQILFGLAYLHNRDIMHRDIKAGNILLDQNGTCKITDFGLSKLSGQDKAYDPHSNNSVMRGTVFWMAPEVVKGTKYNAKVDIWSLGCTVIEMLTGSHPWLDLNMLAALYNLGKYQAPPIPEDITEEAKDFLNKCFTINPEERPTAEQLLEHSFVQTDPSFEFKKYMKKAEVERRASKKKQLERQ